ncbi:MAG: hypothetical protein J6I57_03385 [Desulfovibrio sp.]|nr:hypothetical protein [Desulfovibrio sp.]
MSTVATLTKAGLSAVAAAIKARPLHIAWGSGDEKWDTDPTSKPSLVGATALTNELGRRTIRTCSFCTPDDNGDIVAPSGIDSEGNVITTKYALSDTPQPYLYIMASFDYTDASGATIRECGLFMDTVVSESCPEGQRYFVPGEVTDPGYLVLAQIFDAPIVRSSSMRQSIEFVFCV